MGERLFTEQEFMTGNLPSDTYTDTTNTFFPGLSALCTRISSTGLRTAKDPINLIVTGGAVSVLYLRNRASTCDIDYAVQPLDFKLIEVLAQLGWDVAREFHWPLSWFSGDVAGFLDDNEYISVPAESV